MSAFWCSSEQNMGSSSTRALEPEHNQYTCSKTWLGSLFDVRFKEIMACSTKCYSLKLFSKINPHSKKMKTKWIENNQSARNSMEFFNSFNISPRHRQHFDVKWYQLIWTSEFDRVGPTSDTLPHRCSLYKLLLLISPLIGAWNLSLEFYEVLSVIWLGNYQGIGLCRRG